MSAKFYYKYGAMGSGKTRDLMKVKYNYSFRKCNVLIMKPNIDTKGGDKVIVSRDGAIMTIDYLVDKNDNLYEMMKELKNTKIDCILIDESQFLEPHHIDELSDVVDYLDIPVICFGLRADAMGNLFPGSKRLFELADKIEEIKTVCACGRKATMNVRMTKNGECVFEGAQVAIDGEDYIYDSMCRKCYKEAKVKTLARKIK